MDELIHLQRSSQLARNSAPQNLTRLLRRAHLLLHHIRGPVSSDLFDTDDEWADLDALLARLDEDQHAAVEAIRERKGAVQCPAAAGCHARGQGVLSAHGTILKVEDVRVGQHLMGPDGRARRVIGLGRGRAMMWRVVPVKGTPFVVNGAHVLPLVQSKEPRHDGKRLNITVDELVAAPWRHAAYKLWRVGVGDFVPVYGSGGAPELPIEPYFLGVLLGDGGGFKEGVPPNVSKPDPEILAEVQRQANIWGLCVKSVGLPTNPTHHLAQRTAPYPGSMKEHQLKAEINRLGLKNIDCADRFVPAIYKCASRTHRLEMLAGLLDTDGSMQNSGFDFISKSARLADDTAFLARSVGLAAYVKPCEKGCQGGFVGRYYRVSITGDCDVIPTRIPRKKAPPRRQVKSVLRTGIKAIEPVGVDDYFGFAVESVDAESPEDNLYLLDDFTVTHNSGKTLTLVAAIGALIRDGVPENRIVATTFTARGGEELRQRVAKVLGARRAAAVRIGTFHSLGVRAVRAAQIPVLSDMTRNMDGGAERRAPGVLAAGQLWSRILGYRAIAELRNKPGLNVDLKALDLSVGDYALAVGLIRSRGIDYKMREAREAAKDVKLPQFWKAWGYYEEIKMGMEAFDFADVLAAYRDGLKAGTIKDSADIVIIDEVQDDDEVQTEIAALLAGTNPLVAVGDEKQAIFSWRGAPTRFFLDFTERFQAKSCPLRRNYRSVPSIVEMGNRIAKDKAWSLGADAIAVRPAPPHPCIHQLETAPDPIKEGAAVAKRIRAALDEGALPDDFAVLTRTNAILGAYEAGCIRHRVPCVVIGGQGFFTKKETQAVLAYAGLIGHDSITQLEKVLDTPKRFLGAKFLDELRSEWKPGQDIVAAIRRVAPRVRGRADQLANDIERLRVAGWPTAEDMRREDVDDTVLDLDGDGPPARDDEARLRGLALVAQILLGEEKEKAEGESAEDRDPEKDTSAMTWAAIRIAATFPSPRALFEFAKLCIGNVGTVDGERARDKQSTKGKVALSTVFKAKGLEYKNVIVSCSAGNFPHARAVKAWERGSRERIEEEERLFYVAVTRAQDRLEFASAARDLQGRAAGPSPFQDYVEGTCETFVGDYVDKDEEDDGTWRPARVWADDEDILDGPAPALAPAQPVSTPARDAFAESFRAAVRDASVGPALEKPREWTGTQFKAARAAEVERLTSTPVQILAKSGMPDLEALLFPLGFVRRGGNFRGLIRGHVHLDLYPFPHARLTAMVDTPRGHRPVIPDPPILRYTARWRVDLLDLIDRVNDEVWRVPCCPDCTGPCARRSNERGAFWGCMQFPECRGIAREKP